LAWREQETRKRLRPPHASMATPAATTDRRRPGWANRLRAPDVCTGGGAGVDVVGLTVTTLVDVAGGRLEGGLGGRLGVAYVVTLDVGQ